MTQSKIYISITLIIIAGCTGNIKQPGVVSLKKDTATAKQLLAAQDNKNHPDYITPFILNGYSILDSITGDLNIDSIPDMILVLKKDGEDTMNTAPLRPLLLLIRQNDGSLKLGARNDSVVYTHDMGGVSNDEPFEGAEIEKGTFSIKHFGGMGSFEWETTTTFKYNATDNKWYLFRQDDWSANPEYIDNPKKLKKSETTKSLTEKDFGKVRFEDFSFNKYDNSF
jgi:hypothetical protein